MEVRVRLLYEGPRSEAEILVDHLQDLGFDVRYEPAPEHPDVIVELILAEMWLTIDNDVTFRRLELAVERFRRRFPDTRVMLLRQR
jgi:hypothetical protein